MLLKFCSTVTLFCFVITASQFCFAQKEEFSVAFINPDNQESPFWGQLSDYMHVAASKLGIDLTIHYANSDRYKSAQIADSIANSESKPDYLVMMYQVGVGHKILESMRASDIPVFIINTDIHPHDKPKVGLPRQGFKNWIGHMSPNDFAAGQNLADFLFSKVDGEAKVLAISGSRDSSAALDRNQGLYFAVQESAQANLLQLVFSEWDPFNAGKQSLQLLNRYDSANVVWTVSDPVAIAAAHTKRTISKSRNVKFGGIDWSRTGLKAVKDGWIDASFGGHFMEGAWALAMLYDHHHGRDFVEEGTRFYTQMHLAHSGNIDDYYDALFFDKLKAFDFTSLSKVLNPKRKTYNLNIQQILDEFARQQASK